MSDSSGSHDTAAELARATRLQQAGDLGGAESIYRGILAHDSGNPSAALGLGSALFMQGRAAEALEHLETAVAGDADDVNARWILQECLRRLDRHAEAATHLEAVATQHPDFVEVHNNLGNLYRELGEPDKARASLERALELRPDMPEAHINLGSLYFDMGLIDLAEAQYRRAISLRPDYAKAYRNLTIIRKFSDYDEDVQAMESLYSRPGLADADVVQLAFGLGKAFDDLGQHSKAFRYWAVGNRTQRRLAPHRVEVDIEEMEAMERTFTADLLKLRSASESMEPQPIFVVGMPRSGTSLTEQILASHSLVHGAGELESIRQLAWHSVPKFPGDLARLSADDWRRLGARYIDEVAALSNGARYTVDKMPRNFAHIGIIRLMLPGAKIVHVRRDPMDTCLSCFQNYFYTNGMAYTCDLADLGRYYRQYEKLMTHWREALPGYVFEISYEELVADTERAVRGLLGFCGLEFEDECLAFYKTQRRVATASATQVRQPIHGKSVGRWRNYANYLEPLRRTLD